MRTHLLIASALALLTVATAANALTVTNRDNANHTLVTTTLGGKTTDQVVKPHATVKIDCAKGCELRLGSQKAEYKKNDMKVMIKNGKFVAA